MHIFVTGDKNALNPGRGVYGKKKGAMNLGLDLQQIKDYCKANKLTLSILLTQTAGQLAIVAVGFLAAREANVAIYSCLHGSLLLVYARVLSLLFPLGRAARTTIRRKHRQDRFATSARTRRSCNCGNLAALLAVLAVLKN